MISLFRYTLTVLLSFLKSLTKTSFKLSSAASTIRLFLFTLLLRIYRFISMSVRANLNIFLSKEFTKLRDLISTLSSIHLCAASIGRLLLCIDFDFDNEETLTEIRLEPSFLRILLPPTYFPSLFRNWYFIGIHRYNELYTSFFPVTAA